MLSLIDHQRDPDPDYTAEMPRQVTRSQFRELAEAAGWKPEVVKLFLSPRAPVRVPVNLGVNFGSVVVTDW